MAEQIEQPKRPRTEAQREASRRNGAKSTGPTTGEGKRRSSQNALTHGLTSLRITIDGESGEGRQDFLNEYLEHYQPVGPVERDTVLQLAYVAFRLRRLMPLEAARVDAEQSKVQSWLGKAHPNFDAHLRQSVAYENSAKALEFLSRYESRLKRQMKDHLHTLEKLQHKRQAEAGAARNEERQKEPDIDPRVLSINQMIRAGLAPGLSPKAPWNRTIAQLQDILDRWPQDSKANESHDGGPDRLPATAEPEAA